MPDIMMCNADACPKSKACYRHADSGTRPDPYAQTYWLREVDSPTGDACPHFWSAAQYFRAGRAALEQSDG